MKKIILASKSPRRDEILNMAGLRHEIIVSDADETLDGEMSAPDAVKELSKRKAEAVVPLVPKDGQHVIIAADTMVEVGGEIYGKPLDAADAEKMLRALSGSRHFVHTGITVTDGELSVSETVTTVVKMRPLEEEEIEGYIKSREPFDKAGAYGIQGIAGAFVESLEGDYFNVMGLPICRVSEILKEFGIGLFDE